ncbi:hypothetical protein TH9_22115 [Thalassospira xiamenensis]|nr:hypothetical protein TH9_22115 [Thalassospira xiamenensis]
MHDFPGTEITSPKGRGISVPHERAGLLTTFRLALRFFSSCLKHRKPFFELLLAARSIQLADTQPDVLDKYLYVGATRVATYLGLTCEDGLPEIISTLEGRFGVQWV